MKTLVDPIFENKLPSISWKKIYSREYGVSYSEGAILCLSHIFSKHIPKPSEDTIVIPEGNNTAFFIDATSWIELVESLNHKYTSHTVTLKKYEEGFLQDGENYLNYARKINRLKLENLTNYELKVIYKNYQDKLLKYSVYAWTSFILNNYISEKATAIIDKYIKRQRREDEKQEIYNSLFHPEKKAAILKLQEEAQKHKEITSKVINNLYEKYKWLSCLDIHNDPWTKSEFKNHIKSFADTSLTKIIDFNKIAKALIISKKDLNYLLMAQKFVFIKDARDDFRRQSVFLALPFFKEVGKRMGIKRHDVSLLQQAEIIAFLSGKQKISHNLIRQRKKGFVLYLDKKGKPICLAGEAVPKALIKFKLLNSDERIKTLQGRVASQGKASGRVVIVKGVKDLPKVKIGDILVAVTTHPDYVPVMRKTAAIITDEGGITSHAAIVAREFGIPCIVGTKQATVVLKDGDKVEVNAFEGIIKLL